MIRPPGRSTRATSRIAGNAKGTYCIIAPLQTNSKLSSENGNAWASARIGACGWQREVGADVNEAGVLEQPAIVGRPAAQVERQAAGAAARGNSSRCHG